MLLFWFWILGCFAWSSKHFGCQWWPFLGFFWGIPLRETEWLSKETQAFIAWFTSTRGVYQLWLGRSLTFEFAQVECLSCSVLSLLSYGLTRVHSTYIISTAHSDLVICVAIILFLPLFPPTDRQPTTQFSVYGHIMLKTPVLVWSLKLSNIEPC